MIDNPAPRLRGRSAGRHRGPMRRRLPDGHDDASRGRQGGGPSLLLPSAGAEDHPLAGTNDATGIALTVTANGELTAPWLSGPPGSFTRTVSVPIAKNDCVML